MIDSRLFLVRNMYDKKSHMGHILELLHFPRIQFHMGRHIVCLSRKYLYKKYNVVW